MAGLADSLPNMHGSSLLHSPMKQPRKCPSLRIPFDYCLCERNSTKIVTTSRDNFDFLIEQLAEVSVARINQELRNLSYLCAQLTLISKSFVLEKLDFPFFKTPESTAFRIEFKARPSNGHFVGYVQAQIGS